MQIDEFLSLARTRRSIRRWKPDPVPDEYVQKILEAARWSMSGANAQPWEFIVIKDRETKKKMAEAFEKYLEMSFIMEQARSEEHRHHGFRGKAAKKALPWVDAPVVICVVGDQRTVMASALFFRYYDHPTFEHNMANATHMICLAAASLGLGAEWVSVHQPYGEEIKRILGIPPAIRVFTLVPIGYPAEAPRPYRRELNDLIHHEKYEMSKFRPQADILEYIKLVRERRMTGLRPPAPK